MISPKTAFCAAAALLFVVSVTACGEEASTEGVELIVGDEDSRRVGPMEDVSLDDIAPPDLDNSGESVAADDAVGEAEMGENTDNAAASVIFMPLASGGDVVSFVDIDRYMGRWYEIATTPSFQHLSCTNTQAEYTYDEAMGRVDVVNSCSVRGGSQQQEVRGIAELVDTDTQAKLAVSFFGQRAPYWVVALDGTEGTTPYQWAVVSGPSNQFIWILSRTPEITADERSAIDAHLTERGFPVDSLIDTQHDAEN